MDNRLAALIPCANDDYSLAISAQAIAPYVDEVLILDDASEDSTPEVMEWLSARNPNVYGVRAHRPCGWSNARNQLVGLTEARHVLFIDADDIFCEWQANTLVDLVESGAVHVQLGLAEMWGDFRHGTGRGLCNPHFDPCHCYVDRGRCPNARWETVNSHAVLVTGATPSVTMDVLFWHAKGVKSDWRLVARKHMNRWMKGGRSGSIGAWQPFADDLLDLHEMALRRLLTDRIDPIARLPGRIRIPDICHDMDRFQMQYRDERLIDRVDQGWALEGIGTMPTCC